MSNLLIDDRPIMFLPMLAKALGSCERAIVLQQIHWLSRLPNSGVWDDDGLHWVWGTYDEWCRDYFLMWQPRTLKMHIQNLEKMGVLFSIQPWAKKHDQTKAYRVNYAHELLSTPMGHDHVPSNEQHRAPSNKPDHVPSSIDTKTSPKTPQKKDKRPTQGRKESNRRYTDTPADDAPQLYSLKHHPDL